ncbi:MAG: twin-arginine translocase subunit TatB [Alphaproteobacteria bacterium]|nr:twin-arginine translocase subunit TatB [Alphaproteobacteria bacterium]
MLDVDISEVAVIAVIALVVIGPKDLPKVLRVMGQWTRKARAMAGEFQKSVDDMMRESELDDLRKQAQAFNTVNVQAEIERAVDPKGEVASALSIENHQTNAAAVLPPPSDAPADEPPTAQPETQPEAKS